MNRDRVPAQRVVDSQDNRRDRDFPILFILSIPVDFRSLIFVFFVSLW
jgi:hypothetical protein